MAAEKAGSLPLQEGELRATSEPSNATSSGVYRVGSVNKRHCGVQCSGEAVVLPEACVRTYVEVTETFLCCFFFFLSSVYHCGVFSVSPIIYFCTGL